MFPQEIVFERFSERVEFEQPAALRLNDLDGLVGGGGIGESLRLSISRGHEAKTLAIVILLFTTIVAVDQFSAYLRKRIVGNQAFAFGSGD